MNIYQPIPDGIASIDEGDVFKDVYFTAIDARANAVVVTPTCDLQQKKAQFVKFISTVPLAFVINIIADSVGLDSTIFDPKVIISSKKLNQLTKALRHNTNGDLLPRYHLLPGCPNIFPASYLDFQRVFVISFEEVYREYLSNRVARIVSPWREKMVAQYAGYSMRVGVPDYSEEDLKSLITEAGITISP